MILGIFHIVIGYSLNQYYICLSFLEFVEVLCILVTSLLSICMYLLLHCSLCFVLIPDVFFNTRNLNFWCQIHKSFTLRCSLSLPCWRDPSLLEGPKVPQFFPLVCKSFNLEGFACVPYWTYLGAWCEVGISFCFSPARCQSEGQPWPCSVPCLLYAVPHLLRCPPVFFLISAWLTILSCANTTWNSLA